MESPL
jgi:hypothetical protein